MHANLKVELYDEVLHFNLVDMKLCNTMHCILSTTPFAYSDKVSNTEAEECKGP